MHEYLNVEVGKKRVELSQVELTVGTPGWQAPLLRSKLSRAGPSFRSGRQAIVFPTNPP